VHAYESGTVRSPDPPAAEVRDFQSAIRIQSGQMDLLAAGWRLLLAGTELGVDD
jgi:hypothetical protein